MLLGSRLVPVWGGALQWPRATYPSSGWVGRNRWHSGLLSGNRCWPLLWQLYGLSMFITHYKREKKRSLVYINAFVCYGIGRGAQLLWLRIPGWGRRWPDLPFIHSTAPAVGQGHSSALVYSSCEPAPSPVAAWPQLGGAAALFPYLWQWWWRSLRCCSRTGADSPPRRVLISHPPRWCWGRWQSGSAPCCGAALGLRGEKQFVMVRDTEQGAARLRVWAEVVTGPYWGNGSEYDWIHQFLWLISGSWSAFKYHCTEVLLKRRKKSTVLMFLLFLTSRFVLLSIFSCALWSSFSSPLFSLPLIPTELCPCTTLEIITLLHKHFIAYIANVCPK